MHMQKKSLNALHCINLGYLICLASIIIGVHGQKAQHPFRARCLVQIISAYGRNIKLYCVAQKATCQRKWKACVFLFDAIMHASTYHYDHLHPNGILIDQSDQPDGDTKVQ